LATALQLPRPYESIDKTTTAYRNAATDAKFYSNDALLSFADAEQYNVIDPETDNVARILACNRLAAIRDELTRRERLSRIENGVPSPADLTYQKWRDLALLVRERLEISHIFDAAGYELKPAGINGRRHCPEWSGYCPVCANGKDRLKVWDDGAKGRAWCRVCGWSTDHIGAAMSLRQLTFRDAVSWLAMLAMITPEPNA
jgi:hypothetical protein